jgi:hypothetical protein
VTIVSPSPATTSPVLTPILNSGRCSSAAARTGAQRVVLVRPGDPEDRHHGVADELLHRSAVAPRNRPRVLEPGRHLGAHGLRVAGLTERRGADHVGKEHGHGLPHLAGGGRLGERRTARPTEAEAVRVLLTALGANDLATKASVGGGIPHFKPMSG